CWQHVHSASEAPCAQPRRRAEDGCRSDWIRPEQRSARGRGGTADRDPGARSPDRRRRGGDGGGGPRVLRDDAAARGRGRWRAGMVIGVVPGFVAGLDDVEDRIATDVRYDLPAGYPNEWVELTIFTHLPDRGTDGALASSRNHLNVLSADAIVALPGGEGTES